MKSNKRKNGFIIALFVAVFMMAVGYAAFSQDLFINATGGILADWRLEFTDVEAGIAPAGANYENTAVIDTMIVDNDLIINVEASFDTPNVPISWEVEITNFSGTWDALLEEIQFNLAASVLNQHITWSITGLEVDDVIDAEDSVTFTLTAVWNLNTTEIPETTGTWSDADTYKEPMQIVLSFVAQRP